MKVTSRLIEGASFGTVAPEEIDDAILAIVADGEYINHTIATGYVSLLGVIVVKRFVYLTVVYREKSAE